MGAYLSEPVTDKVSTEGESDRVRYGASSMQGWRISQEDAHNCILDFDKHTSLFAVYDGHGGHEVASYCSQKLPDFIKQTEAYKKGELNDALIEAFLGFDASIATQEVIATLKELVSDKYKTEQNPDESNSEDEENVSNLYEEASMPIEEVMQKYQANFLNPNLKKLQSDKAPVSPYLRARKPSDESSCAGSSKDFVEENEVTSMSNGDASASPDSSSDAKINGEISEKPEVCSSTTSQENGEISPSVKGKGKAIMKKSLEIEDKQTATKVLPARKARQLYNKLLEFSEEDEESDSEDENDETFDGVAETNTSSDEDEEVDESEEIDESEENEDEMEEDEQEPGSDSGCTAVIALLRNNELVVANAGDSRCVICRNGIAIEMSIDHKPEDAREMARIVNAGGKVTGDGRVDGGLNLSRAIGDHAYKQNKELSDREQMITALPDIKTLTLKPSEDEFMVLACDGIWNFMSSQEVVEFVRPRLRDNEKLSVICQEMFDHCIAPNTMGDGTGCDNMTAIIVQFKDGVTKRSVSPDSQHERESAKRLKTDV